MATVPSEISRLAKLSQKLPAQKPMQIASTLLIPLVPLLPQAPHVFSANLVSRVLLQTILQLELKIPTANQRIVITTPKTGTLMQLKTVPLSNTARVDSTLMAPSVLLMPAISRDVEKLPVLNVPNVMLGPLLSRFRTPHQTI